MRSSQLPSLSHGGLLVGMFWGLVMTGIGATCIAATALLLRGLTV